MESFLKAIKKDKMGQVIQAIEKANIGQYQERIYNAINSWETDDCFELSEIIDFEISISYQDKLNIVNKLTDYGNAFRCLEEYLIFKESHKELEAIRKILK